MTKPIRNGILFVGLGVFCLMLGLSMNQSTPKEESIKYCFLFAGISIIGLYLGLSGGKPSYGGGVVRKYSSILVGALSGLYSMYLIVKLL